jgi:hypothetical protein
MRSVMCTLVLLPALSTSAFAIDKVSVDVPFSFESHGKVFPASQYDVSLTADRSRMTMTRRTNPADGLSWMAEFTEKSSTDPELSLQFDRAGKVPELRVVRLGTYQTPTLDAHSTRLQNKALAHSGQ